MHRHHPPGFCEPLGQTADLDCYPALHPSWSPVAAFARRGLAAQTKIGCTETFLNVPIRATRVKQEREKKTEKQTGTSIREALPDVGSFPAGQLGQIPQEDAGVLRSGGEVIAVRPEAAGSHRADVADERVQRLPLWPVVDAHSVVVNGSPTTRLPSACRPG